MSIYRFEVPGIPTGKARPRFGKHGVYTPEKTVIAENKIAIFAKQAGVKISNDEIGLNLKFYFPIPKSFTKEKKAKAIENQIKPAKRPDIDNLIKCVMDGLNGIAYNDDCQIVWITADKSYALEPRTFIEIWNEKWEY